MKYTYIKSYKDNDKMRKSLNELNEKTFGFNFENWYSNGLWGDKFIPHFYFLVIFEVSDCIY